MRILSRSYLAGYLRLFAAILSASMLAIAIIEVMLHFDDISARGGGLGSVVEWLRVRLPSYYLRDLIPLASFGAAFLCLALPARRHELTAITAAGISPLRVGLPVLAAAAALSAGTLVVDETLVLRASREWSRLEAAGQERLFRRGSFWYHTGDLIYNVSGADPETRTLGEVDLYELSPEGRLLRSLRAQGVRVAPDRRWHLRGATQLRFDPDRPTAPPRVESLERAVLDPGEGRDRVLVAGDAGSLSLADLRDELERLTDAGRPAVRQRALLHARLADPLGVLAFALLAVPLGLRVERTRSLSTCALRGAVALGAFYAARTLASLLVLGGVAWAALSPWILLALVGGWGLAGLLRSAR